MSNNPFSILETKLDSITNLLLDLKNAPPKVVEPDNEKPRSVKETADFLNLKVPTVYSKNSRGELPGIKRGGRLYFLQSDLLNYVKEGNRQKSEGEI